MTSYTNVFGDDTVPPSGMKFRLISLVANVTLAWPDNYEGPDFLADFNNVTASLSGWHIALPPGNQQSVGKDFVMRNVGLYPFQVDNYRGVPVATVDPGEAKYFYNTDNSTDSGSWSVITYGTGTSQADASLLSGPGLAVIGAQLAQAHTVNTYTSSVTVQASDRASLITFTGGSASVTLPDVLTIGNNFFVMIKNAGSGTISIQPSGVDRIDNLTSQALAPGESCFVICTGATWYVVGYGRSTQFQFTKLVKDVSAGGTFTLTSGEAANKLLQFNGSPATNVTIIVPSIVGVYYLQNAYTGAASLTIKTQTGTGVTTGNTDKAILFCDGVNVVAATSVSGGGGGGSGAGTFGLNDGSAPTPALFFSADTNTGVYRITSDTLGLSTNGAEIARFSAATVGFSMPLGVGIKTPVSGSMLDVRGPVLYNGNGATNLAGGLPTGVMSQIAASSGTASREVIDGYGTGSSPYLTLRSANGSLASPQSMSIGNNLGQVTFRGRGATTWSGDRGWVIGRASENWTDTAQGTMMLLAVTPNGTTTPLVKFVLDQNGWCTIGSDSNPTATLDVVGNAKIEGTALAVNLAAIGPNFPCVLENSGIQSHGMIQLRFTNSGGVGHDVGYVCANDAYPFKILHQAGNLEVFRVRNNTGGVDAYAYNTISDERLKHNWRDLSPSFLEKLALVKHGYFSWDADDSQDVGVSAQSFEQVLKELVTTDTEGYKSISYGNAALVACVQLAREVLCLRAEVNELKA